MRSVKQLIELISKLMLLDNKSHSLTHIYFNLQSVLENLQKLVRHLKFVLLGAANLREYP